MITGWFNVKDAQPKLAERVIVESNGIPMIGKLAKRSYGLAWIDDNAMPLLHVTRWATLVSPDETP